MSATFAVDGHIPEAWREPLLSWLVSSAQNKYIMLHGGALWAKGERRRKGRGEWSSGRNHLRQTRQGERLDVPYDPLRWPRPTAVFLVTYQRTLTVDCGPLQQFFMLLLRIDCHSTWQYLRISGSNFGRIKECSHFCTEIWVSPCMT